MSEPSANRSADREAQGSNPGPSRAPLSDAHKAAISATKKGVPIKKRALWKLEKRVCARAGCGNVFSPTYQPQRFCSRTCSLADRHPAHLEQLAERTQTLREVYDADPRRCPCGTAIAFEDRHLVKTYCSDECRERYGKKRQRDDANWVIKTCRNCGKDFEIRRSSQSPGYYCSNACARRHTKTTQHVMIRDFDIVLDSSYEAFVWGALKIAKITVERFDRTYDIEWSPGRLYGPDLWLPRQQLAIECKGMVDSDDEAKWAAFRERGKLLVLTRSDLLILSPDALLAML